jgi:hypothetical protein
MVREDLCFLALGRRIGLRLLLGQLTRMHDHKTQGCLRHLALTVFDLYLPDDALPTPTSTRFILGTPGVFHHEGQGRLLLSPRFQFVAHRTGAWHQGHQAKPLFQTQA